MKTKQIIVTPGGNANAIYIATVLGQNQTTGEQGFLVYGFKANEVKPTDTSNGKLLIDTLFDTEDEALKAGEKIVKAQVKADYDRFKKAQAQKKKKRKK